MTNKTMLNKMTLLILSILLTSVNFGHHRVNFVKALQF